MKGVGSLPFGTPLHTLQVLTNSKMFITNCSKTCGKQGGTGVSEWIQLSCLLTAVISKSICIF